MNPAFYNFLACPACGGFLASSEFERSGNEITEGLLTCGCGAWYPVTRGVARMFAPGPLRNDDARFLEKWRDSLPKGISAEAPAAGNDQVSQAKGSFGFKWKRQESWGMEGASAEMMEQWLLPRYGWDGRDGYERYMKTRSVALDAGCGLGREALRMALANPAMTVAGIELSDCVDEAREHAVSRNIQNVFFVQGDINNPPFRHGAFDFIISEGVLHHTPDTKKAFLALLPLLKLGGELAFYVYRKKSPIREYADDYVRSVIKDMPPEDAWKKMEPLTRLAEALSSLNAKVVVPEDVEVLGIKAGEHDIQRLIYYTMFKCYWNGAMSFDDNVLINYDWYHPVYAWRQTEEEVRGWLAEAGLVLTHMDVSDSGITARAALSQGGER